MKHTNKLVLTAVMVLVLLVSVIGVALAWTVVSSLPASDGGITPYKLIPELPDEELPGGNVKCAQLGYDFGSGRVNYGGDEFVFPDGITVTVTDGTFVAWTSTFPIGAVIVKGGPAANIYEYSGGSYGDSGLASPINSSGGSAGLSNLTFCWNLQLAVTKTANTSFDRNWTWGINKDGDKTSLTLSPGQTFAVNYTVTLTATPADSNWTVWGDITITNPNPTAAAIIASVTDVVSPDISAPVSCGVTFPYTLAAGQTLTCTYSTALPDGSARTNTATVATTGKVPGGSGTADVVFGAPANEYDECVTVTDDKYGALGTVCAGDAAKTFTYVLNVGPYDVCGEYSFVNVASFVTNDTGATGSNDHTVLVTVPCAGGCTLTQGYWKTHSAYGPAPYDSTWALLLNGADTPFFLSGQTWYQVFWTAPAGNVYYNLAHQYMAAKLNALNGASSTPAVNGAITYAENFFNTYFPTSTLSKSLRNTVINKASILDQYNNGLIGPGHCSE